MLIRSVTSSDYSFVHSVINKWWDGRQMQELLPKLFFDHFQNTSFIIELDGQVCGFLIGFLSQTYPNEAYIHFVGVHPEFRKHQLGRKLYEAFFQSVLEKGASTVRSVTSPINKTSIAFHLNMGFTIEEGNSVIEGYSVHTNYDGSGQDRILFKKVLLN